MNRELRHKIKGAGRAVLDVLGALLFDEPAHVDDEYEFEERSASSILDAIKCDAERQEFDGADHFDGSIYELPSWLRARLRELVHARRTAEEEPRVRTLWGEVDSMLNQIVDVAMEFGCVPGKRADVIPWLRERLVRASATEQQLAELAAIGPRARELREAHHIENSVCACVPCSLADALDGVQEPVGCPICGDTTGRLHTHRYNEDTRTIDPRPDFAETVRVAASDEALMAVDVVAKLRAPKAWRWCESDAEAIDLVERYGRQQAASAKREAVEATAAARGFEQQWADAAQARDHAQQELADEHAALVKLREEIAVLRNFGFEARSPEPARVDESASRRAAEHVVSLYDAGHVEAVSDMGEDAIGALCRALAADQPAQAPWHPSVGSPDHVDELQRRIVVLAEAKEFGDAERDESDG